MLKAISSTKLGNYGVNILSVARNLELCCVNILSAVQSLMSCSQVVPLASYRDGYYGVYDWWMERFHNVLKAISSTKLW